MHEDRGPGSLAARLQELMDERQLWGYHSATPVRDRKGWPDWAIIGQPAGPRCTECGQVPAGMIFRELKTEHGTLSPAQREIGARLIVAGQDWAVWRPRDILSGAIERALDRIS